MDRKIAIIAGAGPAGLTAAYELLKRTDIQPIVLEQTAAIGGIAQTYNYKGNRIDIGGHRFFSKNERVMNWWFNILPRQGAPAADSLGKGQEMDYAADAVLEFLCPQCVPPQLRGAGTTVWREAPDPEQEDDVMLQRTRLSRIFFRRRFFPYPIAIKLSVAARLGFWNTLLIGLSYLTAQLFPRRDETYLDAFLINRFGWRLYVTFFRDYTEKIWGMPCERIRADWGAQRIKGLSLKRALIHAVKDLLSSDFHKSQQEREASLITRFYYPKFGPGQMWETVARQVTTCGGEVHLRHRVNAVHLREGKVVSITVENGDTGETRDMPCDYFFSTMPIKHLIGMITPHPPPRVVEVAEGLQYRDHLTVSLLLNKLHIRQPGQKAATSIADNWIYMQDGDVRVGRIQVFNNWSPYLVANPKTVWIGLEYFVNEGGDLWVLSDEQMIDIGKQELEKVGLINAADVIDACVLRTPKAYPAYFGSYGQLHVVQEYVDAIPNLFLIGRNGMHRYNNQDHSMLTAMMAVENILEHRVSNSNLWDVNTEMVYHEERNKHAIFK